MRHARKTKSSNNMDSIKRLLAIMSRLRDPKEGCSWDIEQTFDTIAPHTIEEAYEVAEAIKHRNMDELREELGDLLLQVVFHAQIAKEQGIFSFNDVINSISEKLVKRHPNIFNKIKTEGNTNPSLAWEEVKALERVEKARKQGRKPSALDGIATALPALTRAIKMQNRAAQIGFDWPTLGPVLDKLKEEIEELQIEIEIGTKSTITEELGDLLFSVVNLARHLKIDPEIALQLGNDKFEQRFKLLEAEFEERGDYISRVSLDTLELAWQNIKSKTIS